MKKLFVLGVVFTLLAVSASAQTSRDRIARHRIERGFDHGQLTRHEKFRLQKNEFRYKSERRRALRDGKVTPMERRRLQSMKRQNSRDIFRMKHNGRRRAI